MSKSAAKPVRRKWRFEKGRSSHGVILAFLATAAVVAAVTGLFRYEYRQEHVKVEKSSVERINLELNYGLKAVLDRHDPARIFGITGPDTADSFAQKDYSVKLNAVTVPEIKTAVPEQKKVVLEHKNIPVSENYAALLPAGSRKEAKPEIRTKVIAPDGRIVELPELAKLEGNPQKSRSMVKISGKGLLKRLETAVSCGDSRLDKAAENILKNSALAEGVYIINWKMGKKEK